MATAASRRPQRSNLNYMSSITLCSQAPITPDIYKCFQNFTPSLLLLPLLLCQGDPLTCVASPQVKITYKMVAAGLLHPDLLLEILLSSKVWGIMNENSRLIEQFGHLAVASSASSLEHNSAEQILAEIDDTIGNYAPHH